MVEIGGGSDARALGGGGRGEVVKSVAKRGREGNVKRTIEGKWEIPG